VAGWQRWRWRLAQAGGRRLASAEGGSTQPKTEQHSGEKGKAPTIAAASEALGSIARLWVVVDRRWQVTAADEGEWEVCEGGGLLG